MIKGLNKHAREERKEGNARTMDVHDNPRRRRAVDGRKVRLEPCRHRRGCVEAVRGGEGCKNNGVHGAVLIIIVHRALLAGLVRARAKGHARKAVLGGDGGDAVRVIVHLVCGESWGRRRSWSVRALNRRALKPPASAHARLPISTMVGIVCVTGSIMR